jgi:aminotransferase
MMREYVERRDLVVSRVNEIPGMSTPVPGGAFYLFPSIQRTGLSSAEFVDRLLEEEAVAVLPGTNFGGRGEGFIRISYASGRERLEEGLRRIKNFSERLVRQ